MWAFVRLCADMCACGSVCAHWRKVHKSQGFITAWPYFRVILGLTCPKQLLTLIDSHQLSIMSPLVTLKFHGAVSCRRYDCDSSVVVMVTKVNLLSYALILLSLTVLSHGGKAQRYRSLRYHTPITGTDHELRWDFTNRYGILWSLRVLS